MVTLWLVYCLNESKKDLVSYSVWLTWMYWLIDTVDKMAPVVLGTLASFSEWRRMGGSTSCMGIGKVSVQLFSAKLAAALAKSAFDGAIFCLLMLFQLSACPFRGHCTCSSSFSLYLAVHC